MATASHRWVRSIGFEPGEVLVNEGDFIVGTVPPMNGSNRAAIVGAHVHAAIVFHDRDKGLLDRRLGGAPGHDDGVWRRLDIAVALKESSWRRETFLRKGR